MFSRLLIVAAFPTILIGLELGLLLEPTLKKAVFSPPARTCRFVLSDNPVLGYVGRPQGPYQGGVLNNEGFYDDDFDPLMVGQRVALIGDSLVAGLGYPNRETHLTRTLERRLGAHSAEPVDVMALGVAGYNTTQAVELFYAMLTASPHERRSYKLDRAVLTLNAGDADRSLALQEDCSLRDPLSRHFGSLANSTSVLDWLTSGSLRRHIVMQTLETLNRWDLDWIVAETLIAPIESRVDSDNAASWATVEDALNRFRTLGVEHGVTVGVLITPYSPELHVDSTITERLRDVVTTADLPVFDVLPELKGRSTSSTFLDGNSLHLSPDAFATLTPLIANWVESLEVP